MAYMSVIFVSPWMAFSHDLSFNCPFTHAASMISPSDCDWQPVSAARQSAELPELFDQWWVLRITWLITDFPQSLLCSTLWESSTGLTAVGKFKPYLPAQWAISTHQKGSSETENVTSRFNWPVRNSTQNQNSTKLENSIMMWIPNHLSSVFPIGFRGRKNNLDFLNDHMMKGFSCPALPSWGDLSHHNANCQDGYNGRLFAKSNYTKSVIGLCNINKWRKRQNID